MDNKSYQQLMELLGESDENLKKMVGKTQEPSFLEQIKKQAIDMGLGTQFAANHPNIAAAGATVFNQLMPNNTAEMLPVGKLKKVTTNLSPELLNLSRKASGIFSKSLDGNLNKGISSIGNQIKNLNKFIEEDLITAKGLSRKHPDVMKAEEILDELFQIHNSLVDHKIFKK